MRLKDEHISQICRIAEDIYGDDVHVYLFGSKVNDNAKGGDIDLLVESPRKEKMNFKNKIKFLTELKLTIGDQRIDVVYNKEIKRRGSEIDAKELQKSGIVSVALRTGVEL